MSKTRIAEAGERLGREIENVAGDLREDVRSAGQAAYEKASSVVEERLDAARKRAKRIARTSEQAAGGLSKHAHRHPARWICAGFTTGFLMGICVLTFARSQRECVPDARLGDQGA